MTREGGAPLFLSGPLCRVSIVDVDADTRARSLLVLWDTTIRVRWQMEPTTVEDVQRCDVYTRGGAAHTWRSVATGPISLDLWTVASNGYWKLSFPRLERRAGRRNRPTLWEAVPVADDGSDLDEPQPFYMDLVDDLPYDAPHALRVADEDADHRGRDS